MYKLYNTLISLILATNILSACTATNEDIPLRQFTMDDLVGSHGDTNEFWLGTELRTIVRRHLASTGLNLCPRVQDDEAEYVNWSRKSNSWKYEPCTDELNRAKKMWGPEGHLHHDAPRCTQLGLYAPVQCRGWVCYCVLQDGTRIPGIKVPRIDSNKMYCDCARVKCRIREKVKCDAYGNYLNQSLAYYDTAPHHIFYSSDEP